MTTIDKTALETAIKAASVDGRLACGAAREIAENFKIPYHEVGDLADQLKIKISSCQLGCF